MMKREDIFWVVLSAVALGPQQLEHRVLDLAPSHRPLLALAGTSPNLLLGLKDDQVGSELPQEAGFWIAQFDLADGLDKPACRLDEWRRLSAAELQHLGQAFSPASGEPNLSLQTLVGLLCSPIFEMTQAQLEDAFVEAAKAYAEGRSKQAITCGLLLVHLGLKEPLDQDGNLSLGLMSRVGGEAAAAFAMALAATEHTMLEPG